MNDAHDKAEPSRETRASDEERSRVTQRLTEAVGEGRLTLDEFSQRSRTAHQCTSQQELAALLTDLPDRALGSDLDTTRRPPEKRRWKIALLGGSNYGRRWKMPAKLGIFAFAGGSDVDLGAALLPGQDIDITMISILGGSDLIVPRGIRVEADGTSILGGDDVDIDQEAVLPDSPTVRVRTYSFLGGNDVRHPKRPKGDS